jgi:peptidase A4-like protein
MIKRLAVGGAALLALTGMSATGAVASTAGTPPGMAVRVIHITTHGVTATVTIRGNWKLAKIKASPMNLPRVTKAAAGQATSPGWGGYVDTGHNVAFRFVTANFNAPSVNCPGSTIGTSGVAAVSVATALDGATDGALEAAGYLAKCDPSEAVYAFYQMADDEVDFSGPDPGDALVSSVYYNASTGDYELSVTDVSQSSEGISVNLPCTSGTTCPNSSAEVVSALDAQGSPPVSDNLADYGAMGFTNAAVTSRAGVRGNLGKNSLWSPIAVTTVNDGDTLQTVGPLQGNTAFLESWKASA